MRIGDIVHAKSIRRIFKNDLADGWENYKAPTGERFVFMLLGSEPLDGPELDPVAVLNTLGWSTPPAPTAGREQVLEQAAQIAEAEPTLYFTDQLGRDNAAMRQAHGIAIAAAIRALKATTP